jgi:hypothetical protein
VPGAIASPVRDTIEYRTMSNEIDNLKAEIRRLRKVIAGLTPSLDSLLALRGFRIYKKEPSEDLLVPANEYAESFYEELKRYSFRLFLRDVIKHQNSFTVSDVSRYATETVSARYIDFLLKAGLSEELSDGVFRLKKLPIKSFGETLEWFIAELIRTEFGAETVWGVKFRRPHVGGDYDLIAKVGTGILYMEIKSSPPKQIYDREVSAFLKRVHDLAPEVSIFFVDTELRMADKIVPMFESELQLFYGSLIPIQRLVKELFHIKNRIYIINSKGGISSNVETVLSDVWHKGITLT